MFFLMKKHEIAKAVQKVTDFLDSPIYTPSPPRRRTAADLE